MDKLDAYKHGKIEVYGEYTKRYTVHSAEYLAEDILHELDIDFYQIESSTYMPFENPSPHMLIEYTVQITKDHW